MLYGPSFSQPKYQKQSVPVAIKYNGYASLALQLLCQVSKLVLKIGLVTSKKEICCKWQQIYWAIPENIHTPPMDDIGNPVINPR